MTLQLTSPSHVLYSAAKPFQVALKLLDSYNAFCVIGAVDLQATSLSVVSSEMSMQLHSGVDEQVLQVMFEPLLLLTPVVPVDAS